MRRAMLLLLAALWLVLPLAAAGGAALAQSVVADLSEREIRISTGFSGTELLLFGVNPGAGGVIITVTGPEKSVTVRKKSRVSGLWINTESVQFDTVPVFFHVATTADLSTIHLDEVLREHGVGLGYLNLSPADDLIPVEAALFREALLRNQAKHNLFTATPEPIEMVGGGLFRTAVRFPAHVPTGQYRVDVYHVVDGWVTSAATIPLTVHKVGMEASIYRYAHDYPAAYGIFAILIAALAGYGAGMLFGRR